MPPHGVCVRCFFLPVAKLILNHFSQLSVGYLPIVGVSEVAEHSNYLNTSPISVQFVKPTSPTTGAAPVCVHDAIVLMLVS